MISPNRRSNASASNSGWTISEALESLDADPVAPSDGWFTLARDLRCAAWIVGSATYCLDEWREPTDDRADVDTHQEPGEETLPEEERQRPARPPSRVTQHHALAARRAFQPGHRPRL